MEKDLRLDSWKKIADYLDRDVRTVIRWEKERGLPIHRIPGQKRAGVYAWRAEIDSWLSDGDGVRPHQNGFAISAAGVTVDAPQTPSPPRPRKLVLAAATILLALGAVWLSGSWLAPIVPMLGKSVQLTGDGQTKFLVGASGTSLYLVSGVGSNKVPIRMDQSGGRQVPLFQPLGNFIIQDLSPDGSRFLAAETGGQGCKSPLWIIPTDGAKARRLAGLCGNAAGWAPDGRRVAFVNERTLFVVNSDGTAIRRVATLPDDAWQPRWSPDGKVIRLTVHRNVTRIWEVSLDAQFARPLLPGWNSNDAQLESAGRWTPDGKFYLFEAVRNGISDLWVIREKLSFFDWRYRGPFRLTTGTNGISQAFFSADGKKLFAVLNAPDRGDLLRYDPNTRRFAMYPDEAGLSAAHASFSPDGRQVAYVTFPEMGLWKMKADGSSRQMLIKDAVLPQWSPDGRRIAYMQLTHDNYTPTKIRIISADGGPFEEPVSSPAWQGVPTWTANGDGLVFGENGPAAPLPASSCIHRFDFGSHRTIDLPATAGLWTARACPTGRYIAATTLDNRRLVLYDEQTRSRTDLISFPDTVVGDNPTWSKDGKYIYIDSPWVTDPAIYRISIPGGQKERVADLKGIVRAHGNPGLWIGLTPDNLPMILRAVQCCEIFAWDWSVQ